MKLLTILIIIIALLYIISPYDLLPDFFPITGWFDDAFLLGVLLYYLKFRQLPKFLSRFMRFNPRSQDSADSENFNRSGFKKAESRPDAPSPYEILGVKPGAGPDEIRAAYRHAAQAYHPDKVAHLGPELRELAQKKFVEIQEAYHLLMDKHP